MAIALSMAAARGAMSLLERGSLNGDLQAFGIGESQIKLVCQDGPWLAADRHVVQATLEAMVWGTMDAVGLQRFNPPAEYIAAVLATFVKPQNMWLACRWMELPSRAEELATGSVREAEPVRAAQLFSLIVLIEGGSPVAKAAFEKKVGFALDQSSEVPEDGKVRKK